MAFVERKIDVACSFNGDGGALSNLNFSGFRVRTHIKIAGSQAVTATIKIYGLSLSHMNALSRVPFKPTSVGNNTVRVMAGDEINGMSLVFEGTVIQAWPDMQSAPEVFLRIDAVIGAFEAVKPVEPTSFKGTTNVATIAGKIAEKMNIPLENNGVNIKLLNPYLWGTARQQMLMLGQATRMGWIQENGVLAIWPPNGSRTSAGTVNISKETGMVGYPYAVPGGIVVRSLFNRAIKYATTMNVKSDIKLANGSWTIADIELLLDAQVPGGAWFATLFGVSNGS